MQAEIVAHRMLPLLQALSFSDPSYRMGYYLNFYIDSALHVIAYYPVYLRKSQWNIEMHLLPDSESRTLKSQCKSGKLTNIHCRESTGSEDLPLTSI